MQDMQKNSIENNDEDNAPLTKSKSKEKPNLKKVRSEKQIEAFNRTMEIRKQKVNERKEAKLLESAKLLLEKTALKNDQPKPSDKKTPFQKYAESHDDDSTTPSSSSGEDTEDEIIVVKNKPKPKPKPTKEKKEKKKPSRKTIIFESSDESSSESSGGSSEEYIKAPKRITHDQRVKRKEIIEPPIKQVSKPEDFRVYFV
jgi:hypothetical protein